MKSTGCSFSRSSSISSTRMGGSQLPGSLRKRSMKYWKELDKQMFKKTLSYGEIITETDINWAGEARVDVGKEQTSSEGHQLYQALYTFPHLVSATALVFPPSTGKLLGPALWLQQLVYKGSMQKKKKKSLLTACPFSPCLCWGSSQTLTQAVCAPLLSHIPTPAVSHFLVWY